MYIFDVAKEKDCFKTENGKIGIIGSTSGIRIKRNAVDKFDEVDKKSLVMNFDGIDFIDYTFARQIIYILFDFNVSINNNILIFVNLNDTCMTNISASLISHNLFSCTENGLIGKFNNNDARLYNHICESKVGLESSELSEKMKVTISCINERLKKLVNNGVISKEKIVHKSGGVFNLYSSISVESLIGSLNLRKVLNDSKKNKG